VACFPFRLQQRIAETVFQPSDLLAHGRLRAMNALARAGEAAGVDDRDETAGAGRGPAWDTYLYFHWK
jgi:hypothetical protein